MGDTIGNVIVDRVGRGVDKHDGYLRFGGQMLASDATVALDGTDFGEIDSAGALRRIIGFFSGSGGARRCRCIGLSSAMRTRSPPG